MFHARQMLTKRGLFIEGSREREHAKHQRDTNVSRETSSLECAVRGCYEVGRDLERCAQACTHILSDDRHRVIWAPQTSGDSSGKLYSRRCFTRNIPIRAFRCLNGPDCARARSWPPYCSRKRPVNPRQHCALISGSQTTFHVKRRIQALTASAPHAPSLRMIPQAAAMVSSRSSCSFTLTEIERS
jgi:hypothetical protein